MFKEVVISAAILLGFLLNILFVDHPNVASYTIAFVISLVVLSPFVVWWKFRAMRKELGLIGEVEGDGAALTPILTPTALGVSRLLRLGSVGGPVADVEKGEVKPKANATQPEASGSGSGSTPRTDLANV
ncbi:hypothetical protein BGZ60DRAFT_434279 [Tricladium varicosporioides]|nr:hypothetical protein BGZ60DRAFT_434279 [Hymenoscyphus varicosporioides]